MSNIKTGINDITVLIRNHNHPIMRHPLLMTLGVLAMLYFPYCRNADAKPFNEYQVKAVFVYNLTHFVTWPQEAFPAGDASIVIGIMGFNPFGDLLEKVIVNEKVNKRPIVLKHFNHPRQLNGQPCHILFLAQPDDTSLPDWRQVAQRNHILTISDADGFVEKGGMVNLVTTHGRIGIDINLAEIKSARIHISAQLLRLARVHNCSDLQGRP